MAECPGRLGQVRQLGQGSVVGLLAPQLALAHLGHLRQLGQRGFAGGALVEAAGFVRQG